MKESQAKLYLISDIGSDNQIENIFGEIGDYSLEIISTNNISFDQKSPAIFIVLIALDDSPVISKLLKVKNIRKDRFIFLLTESSARSVIKLVRKGFSKIFEIPNDIEDLKKYLLWELKGLDVNFKSKFRSLDEHQKNLRMIMGFGKESDKEIRKVVTISKNTKANILIEGEFGLQKLNLARTIHSLNLKKNQCLTEFILPYSSDGKYSLKIENNENVWYKDASDENELGRLLLPGTIILNNVHEMSLAVQKRLHTAFSSMTEKEIYRIIAITDEDIFELCKKGLFDEKFYYFLSTAHFILTPIRFRKDDIQHLFEHFILEYSKKYSKEITKIDNEVFEFLYTYPWLGNIQELSNAVINAITFANSSTLTIDDFTNVINKSKPLKSYNSYLSNHTSDRLVLEIDYNQTSLGELSEMYVKDLLSKLNNNKSKTAEILGITRPTLLKIIS